MVVKDTTKVMSSLSPTTFVDRQVVGERPAEVAVQQAADPVEVLEPQRPSRPYCALEEGDLLQVDRLALALQAH